MGKKLSDAEQIAAKTIIGATKSDKYEKVYFLGPYARRVAFASQQNRALNLVWALLRTGTVLKNSQIAVIGAGLSGITASLALAREGVCVTLVEQMNKVLHRQLHCRHRYIHPTIGEWPEVCCAPTTAFPYLDWMGNRCADIMESLSQEWAKMVGEHGAVLTPAWNAKIDSIDERDGDVILNLANPDRPDCLALQRFSAAIVTSGFSDENVAGFPFLKTYWMDDNLETFAANEDTRFVVSGCGDGGLIDTLRLIHKDFRMGELIVDVAKALRPEKWIVTSEIAHAEMQAAESTARRSAAKNGSPELAKVYQQAAKRLPDEVAQVLEKSLRRIRDLVKLVSLESVPFSPLAAPIHKLLVAHAMNALVVGHVRGSGRPLNEFAMEVELLPSGDKVTLNGKVVVRHGAGPNFARFLDDIPAFERLRDKQIDIAAELDRPAWAKGAAPLQKWPPERKGGKYDLTLLEDRLRRAKVLRLKLEDLKVRLSADETIGFKVVHEVADTDAAAAVADLPNKLFGFPLKRLKAGADPEPSTAFGAAGGAIAPGVPSNALFPGARLISREGNRVLLNGRLGPFVLNSAGDVLALTVSHLIVTPTSGAHVVVFDENGGPIGRALPPPSSSRGYIADTDCLALIAIDESRSLSNKYGTFECLNQVADPDTLFGQTVYLELSEGIRREGYVSSNDTAVTFTNPITGWKEVYAGVIRIRNAKPKEPFSEPGDSGTPVVTNDGRLVGLILSGRDDCSYVAPARHFLLRNDLQLLTAPRIPVLEHSDRENTWPSAGARGTLAWDLAKMKRKFALEPAINFGTYAESATDDDA